MAIDRKRLADEIVKAMVAEDENYVSLESDDKQLVLDGWWNLEKLAEKLGAWIDEQAAGVCRCGHPILNHAVSGRCITGASSDGCGGAVGGCDCRKFEVSSRG